MDQSHVMVYLTIISFTVMALIAAFVVRVFRRVDQHHRERHFGDISHIKIPDDPSELTTSRQKKKPPYRPW